MSGTPNRAAISVDFQSTCRLMKSMMYVEVKTADGGSFGQLSGTDKLQALVLNGAPGEIRTPDHLVRSQVLYPAELRARGSKLRARILPQPFLRPRTKIRPCSSRGYGIALVPARASCHWLSGPFDDRHAWHFREMRGFQPGRYVCHLSGTRSTQWDSEIPCSMAMNPCPRPTRSSGSSQCVCGLARRSWAPPAKDRVSQIATTIRMAVVAAPTTSGVRARAKGASRANNPSPARCESG
jgi:hypothetical protein